jgi:transposase
MNELKMEVRESIISLSGKGWSQRRIARELGVDRETVARYRRQWQEAGESKPAIVPAGVEDLAGSNPAIVPAGSLGVEGSGSDGVGESKPAIVPAGSGAGRRSQCEGLGAQIARGVEAGLSAQRIFQDLVGEHGFAGSYDAVKRYVRKLGAVRVLPFRRMESEAGEEAQVDYGQGAWVIEEGRRRRPHVLRVVLSFSRKGYAEVFWQQSTENFVRGLENAFRHFGGVPRTLVIDNLRAAVSKADWFDPLLNHKVLSFCEHYGTLILPTKPAMPRHKGKVEAGVKYVQDNALAGREFQTLGAQNLWLAKWEETVADTRIHGTTRAQVRALFLGVEKPQLQSLPASLFPVFSEAPRKVHRDGHVEVAKSYYSVPPEYVQRSVWVRWDTKLVHIYNERRQSIAVHVRGEPGRFCTDRAHIHDHKRALIEHGAQWMLTRARQIGEWAGTWADDLHANRGAQSLRVLQGLLSLAKKYPADRLNEACQLALTHGSWQLRDLRALLARPCVQEQFEFTQSHPLIRDLHAYHALVPACFAPEKNFSNPTTTQPPPPPLDDPSQP